MSAPTKAGNSGRVELNGAERSILLRPCACGHTINDHGSLVACWRCEDDGGDCSTPFEALLVERIETITAAAEARGAERGARAVVEAAEKKAAEWRVPEHPILTAAREAAARIEGGA